MNILLVSPSQLDDDGTPMRFRQANMPPLALATIAGLTPDRHTVRAVNDMVEPVDFEGDYHLVGLTAMTSQAPRAYQIADRFRARGIKVVIGGIHASTLPDEAAQHADAVVIGEVEPVWERLLADLEQGCLAETYAPDGYPTLDRLIIPRWDGFNMSLYRSSVGRRHKPRMPVNTTRGCLYACKFCTVTRFYGQTYRHKPIANVLAEIDAADADAYFFVDDNIVCSADYAEELFAALKGRNIRWLSQASTQIMAKPELIEKAAAAGCRGMFLGIESINKATLQSVRKGFNNPELYPELFARMERVGIRPYAGMIVGLDEDTPETLREMLAFLLRHRVQAVFFNIFTPLPGTELYEEMDAAGRIIERDWSKYDMGHVVFQPKHFSPAELQQTYWEMYRRLYSPVAIAGRLFEDAVSLRKGPSRLVRDAAYQTYMYKQVNHGKQHPLSMGIGKFTGGQ